ncbi:MAG: 30S ribosomal protein S12 methylthiotransferase RimO [Deltaproteobacteria bacterium]|nr:30S ribosomal protein S12 methylthiotransferase RimO [Deltaproteobacteria bacterium]
MANRTLHMVSLGCPKNLVDSEVMLGSLLETGYRVIDDPAKAALILVNTCAFIDASKKESVDAILEMAAQKESGSCERLVVTGCLAQRYVDALRHEIPEVDLWVGTGEFQNIAALVAEPPADGVAVANPVYVYDSRVTRVNSRPAHSVYVKVSEGCGNPCTFCIIPKLRGDLRSRAISDIAAEVANLASRGMFEVNLIAQDLNAYGADRHDGTDLAKLLRAIARIDGVGWVRLHYLYPRPFPRDLLSAIAEEPRVAKYIDIPFQHISDRILRAMKRGRGEKFHRELVEKLRAAIPRVSLRTSLIVGFPGETDRDFERLYDFVEEMRFDHVGVFEYSPEEGTPAGTMRRQVPARVKAERRHRLLTLQRRLSRERLAAYVGREVDVLVDEVAEQARGRLESQAPEVDGHVVLRGSCRPGDLVRARIASSGDYDLSAEVVQILQPSRLASTSRTPATSAQIQLASRALPVIG